MAGTSTPNAKARLYRSECRYSLKFEVAKAALESCVRYLAADLGPQGIRVNAISAGPIKTLASSAIPGIGSKLKAHRSHTPLQRDTDQLEVGDAGVFLVSDMGRGITGQVLYVDGGFSIMAG